MFTKTELKWGVIFSVMGLVWLILEYLVGLHDKFIAWHGILTNLVAIPSVIIMVLAILEKRRVLGGTITFKQAFLCGFGVSLVVAVLSPITQWIFHRLINPGYFENAIRLGVEQGKTTLADAQAFFNLPSYMLQSVFAAVVIGSITSLVIAAMIKKEAQA
ncbi:MAG TPA: DUF4199 domain-containing protein [Blastocatellia bacterium]|nr:DUF4199 domain-containing protein [Blastocatellia bacterium]